MVELGCLQKEQKMFSKTKQPQTIKSLQKSEVGSFWKTANFRIEARIQMKLFFIQKLRLFSFFHKQKFNKKVLLCRDQAKCYKTVGFEITSPYGQFSYKIQWLKCWVLWQLVKYLVFWAWSTKTNKYCWKTLFAITSLSSQLIMVQSVNSKAPMVVRAPMKKESSARKRAWKTRKMKNTVGDLFYKCKVFWRIWPGPNLCSTRVIPFNVAINGPNTSCFTFLSATLTDEKKSLNDVFSWKWRRQKVAASENRHQEQLSTFFTQGN